MEADRKASIDRLSEKKSIFDWIEDAYKTLKDIGEGLLEGITDAVIATFEGIKEMVLNPIETLEGIIYVIKHPKKTAETMWKAIVESWEQDVVNGDAKSRAKWFGRAFGEIALAIIGTKGVDKVAKIAKTKGITRGIDKIKTNTIESIKNVINPDKIKKQMDEIYKDVVKPSVDDALRMTMELKKKILDIQLPSLGPEIAGIGTVGKTIGDLLSDAKETLVKFDGEGTESFKYKKISETPAEDVNKWWKEEMGYSEPPYKPGTLAQEIELSEKTTFVRVYDGENSGMYGGWFMKADDIKGLTPSQIQNKFALPATPKFVVDVELDAGTRIRTGTANPLFGFEGGGQQFDLIGQRVGNFTNPRTLP